MTSTVEHRPILGEPSEPEAPKWAIGDRCTWHLGDVCMGEHVILAKDGDTYWIRDDHGGYDMADREELRPLRTPEDKAVEEMLSIMEHAIEDATDDPAPSEMLIYAARALHRAGYRKT